MAKPITLDALFDPRNVVLVGASDRPGHWSSRVWANLPRFGFKGSVFPLNPKRRGIFGSRCYATLEDLPEPPDHLALFVPADATLEMLDAGGRLGARSATLYAAGFGEGGDRDGAARAERLREILLRHAIAAAGPNCMGLACGRSGLVTIADETLQPLGLGPVAVLTQSGMLTSTINRALNDRGLGVSHIVSCGNQTGLTFANYIDALADDADVRVVLCYVEMIRDATRFLAACRKAASRGKSVIAVKIGGSAEARAAALAHTGAMVGSLDAFDAAATGSGVIRVDSLEEAVEAAELLSRARRPAGSRYAFMTNSGAMKSLMTEAAVRHGVSLAALSPATEQAIHKALGEDAEPSNPLDTKKTIPTDSYIACVDALGRSGDADLVVVIEELPREAGVARKIRNFDALDKWAREGGDGRAAVAVLSPLTLGENDYMKEIRGSLTALPMLRGLDTAFRMLARLGASPLPDNVNNDVTTSRAGVAGLGEPKSLSEPESKHFIAKAGIRLPREVVVATVGETAGAAARIGFPVVIKAVSAGVAHKSDAGLVIVSVTTETAAHEAAATLKERCDRNGVQLEGILVAEQIHGGTEMVLGLHRDPEMGPVLMVGLGGVWLEVMRDVAFAPLDLDQERAIAVIRRTKAWRLLDGFRGAKRGDIKALADAMVALGRLGLELGDRLETIDINPIVVLDEGCGAVALDALVVMRPPPPGVRG